ncbi:MAG: EamA family transporter [Confluentimicrobium sp.]|nr:EamA family transporter [Actibacterium sp.]
MTPATAILFKLSSVTLLVGMLALIKASAGEVPTGEIVFFRSFFAMPVIIVWLISRKELSTGLKTVDPWGHLWRGLVGSAAMALNFMALGLLPLPEVTAISYATPIVVVIFAAMFLGETVRLFRLSAVVIGLVGVLVVLSPRLSSLSAGGLQAGGLGASETLGAVIALGAAVMAALAQVFIRKLTRTERTASIVFWFSVTASILSLTTLPFGWVIPSPGTTAMLIGSGICGGIGQILLTTAYRHADASVIAPFDYASMLLAVVLGYVVFSEVPTLQTLIGAGIVISAGALIIWREHRLGLEREKQRKAMSPSG